MANTTVKHSKKSRKRFTPTEIEQVKADWLNCRNANECAKRHEISPRTVHNWIQKFNWSEDAGAVDSKAQTALLEKATEERVSLIERVQQINDQILEKLSEAIVAPTLADFREGVKLESSLLSGGSQKSSITDEIIDIEDTQLYRRNLMMTPEEMAVECDKLARRLRETIEIERERKKLHESAGRLA